ncbi:MAG: DUF3298 domain-containing protein [Patescibacteria group bacterium]|nr:DUF3298 domain-containing protein [Patescibacteria group bacterium]MCL5261851.1 DUF3298 domain-containing protein [Patescibacteria group bacterium]
MKKKILKSALIASIFFVVGLAVYPFFQGLPAGKGIILKNYNISENNDFFHVRAEYPQFAGVSRAFDSEIKDLVKQKIAEFKKSSNDSWRARRETALPGETVPTAPEAPFDFIAYWDHDRLDDRYVSLIMKIYYFSGAAHGTEELYTFNYDLKNRREINIMDLMGSEENLQKVSKLVKPKVAANLDPTGSWGDGGTEEMLEEGTAPTLENYKNFTFNQDSLTIYFQKYQVAPGASGSQKVVLYRSELKDSGISLNWPE